MRAARPGGREWVQALITELEVNLGHGSDDDYEVSNATSEPEADNNSAGLLSK